MRPREEAGRCDLAALAADALLLGAEHVEHPPEHALDQRQLEQGGDARRVVHARHGQLERERLRPPRGRVHGRAVERKERPGLRVRSEGQRGQVCRRAGQPGRHDERVEIERLPRSDEHERLTRGPGAEVTRDELPEGAVRCAAMWRCEAEPRRSGSKAVVLTRRS